MTAEASTPSGAVPTRRGHRRVRLRQLGRAAVFGSDRHRLPDAIEHLAKAHRSHHPGADLGDLHRAYRLAEAAHRGQTRKSGEPYITHPLAVTLILAELGAETTTLTASLLHDTVEDTDVTLDQVRADFGDEVGHLVDGVTKLQKVEYGAAAESETFRKMLVATGSDVRVMSIKLADRLHNMRTLGVMRPEKQARIARVTRDVLIPLAERLGVHTVKTELEDLVFAVLHPEEHRAAHALVRAHRERPDPLADAASLVRAVLREAGIAAEVQIRPRHLFSVHRARLKRGELGAWDYGRLLILVAENADCYAVLGELHTCLNPVVSEFKDFVAAPKFNLYQSLHTAFSTPDGDVAEVLVRTHAMHRVAENGVIALGDPHRSAEGEPGAEEAERAADPTRPGWLSRLLKWQEQATDPDTFWTELRDELARDREITVFAGSPEDGPLQLPVGATCVDAAYARHGAAAHSCMGARVNGRLATLRTVLRDGDTVQLLLAGDGGSGPSPEWLEHATTPAARVAIRSWLTAGGAQPQDERGEEARRPAPEPERPAAPAGGLAG
ncbi:RelA/SpoT family protein, partial [Streptomyces triticirhizae]